MRTTLRVGAIMGAAALALAACSSAPDSGGTSSSPASSASSGGASSDFQSCMVSDSGGIDDKSFNENSFLGLEEASTELGAPDPKFVESNAENEYAPNITSLLSQDCGIIITVGFAMGDATSAAAKANPDQDFAIVDNVFDPAIENVKALAFDTDQAAFLAGYLAAGMSKTGTVGTFGGMKFPTVTIFMDGFAKGVAHYNEVKGKSVKVLGWDVAKQDGTFTGDFTDKNKGRQTTQNFITQGADIILPVAGPVGEGAAAAAKAAGNVNIIWVDSDGYLTLPQYKDLILTSVLKRMDTAVKTATLETAAGDFSNETFLGTLENEGVGIAPYHDLESTVPAELQAEVEQLQQDVIDGKITGLA